LPPKLSAQDRISLIEQVVLKNEPVSKVCQKAGISRTLFYRWLRRYKKEGTVFPKKRARVSPRRVAREKVLKILELVLAHPKWSSQKISSHLPKIDNRRLVGNHGVQNVLERLSLNRFDKRKQFCRDAKGLTAEQALKVAGGEIKPEGVYQGVVQPTELSAHQRLEMIERVIRLGQSVSQVCHDFKVSRPVYYKWLKRYQAAPQDSKPEALQDRTPKIEHYFRQTPEKYEEAVLSVVSQYPQFGVARIVEVLPEIGGKPIVGHHGVQNILRRYDLNTYEKRLAYSQDLVTPVTRAISALERVGTQFIILPAEVRARLIRFAGVTFLTAFSTVVVLGFFGYLTSIGAQVTPASQIGLLLATLSLGVGTIFFAYSMKYYLTLAVVLSFSRQPLEEGGGYTVMLNGRLNGGKNGNGNGNGQGWLARIFGQTNGNGNHNNGKMKEYLSAGGLQPSLEHISLKRYPFVSIHLPFYNEKKVAERILKACTAMDYPNFEIIVCDDSTDETIEIVNQFVKKHDQTHPNGPKIKVLHRPTREGFKGGALGYALKQMNPKTEFCVVFDADFIPYPDTLELFVKYFKVNNENQENFTQSNLAVVGGYQWHVLNKSENWITRGVRTEYAGSYVIERPGREIMGLLKQISGSVYMIRADVLKKIGWGTSITEDFQLTLKLYEQGYKVVYTPYVQAPAECVSTLKRLIRQRMRWAEGHSNNIRKMFLKLMISSRLSFPEKLEMLYISPYYLQAAFFLVGTFAWLMAETVFKARLPFWTSLWGWSLVLTNFFSLPLVNAVGLFLEESEEKDYLGILSFVALSYILVPFQAYASLKGFIEKEEGPWFRTPKTGKITDIFTRGRFYRWIAGILPGRQPSPVVATAQAQERLNSIPYTLNPYFALATANNQFSNFQIKPKHLRWVSKVSLVVLLIVSSTILSLTRGIPEVLATPPGNYYLSATTVDLYSSGGGEEGEAWMQQDSVIGGTDTNATIGDANTADYWWYSNPYDNLSINADTWTLNVYVSGGSWGGKPGSRAVTWAFKVGYCNGGCDATGDYTTLGTSSNIPYDDTTPLGLHQEILSGSAASPSCSSGNVCRVWLEIYYVSTLKAGNNFTLGYNGSAANYITNIDPPTMTIPEKAVFFITAAPFIPMIVLWMKKRKEAIELLSN
jgi:cellulose synthase/poly-beta-1,6-N-acetylglucosamine synthase-like glycosyltransferase/transposase-like protein